MLVFLFGINLMGMDGFGLMLYCKGQIRPWPGVSFTWSADNRKKKKSSENKGALGLSPPGGRMTAGMRSGGAR